MSPGIVEIISFLLGLQAFGLQPNTAAPTADQALQYAMPDADLIVHLDAASIVPANYKVLVHLPDDPNVKASPVLADATRKMVAELEGARSMVRLSTGVDITTDINDATAFIKFTSPGHDPQFVLAAHGKFTPALLDKMAAMQSGTVVKLGGGAVLEQGDKAIAVTAAGVLLAGEDAMVKARLATTWKAPARAPGTSLGYAGETIDTKPVIAIVMALSPSARKTALAAVGPDNLGSDLVKRHKVAVLAIHHDGIAWTWADTNKAGLDQMATMSEGVLDLFRAGEIAPRGVAKLVLGALASYRATDKHVDQLLRHQDDVLKVVAAFTGDGNFATEIKKEVKTMDLHVRATAKTFSGVVPLGALLPLAAFGALIEAREVGAVPATMPVAVPAQAPHR